MLKNWYIMRINQFIPRAEIYDWVPYSCSPYIKMRWVFGLSDAGPSQTPWLLPPPSVHTAYSKTSLKHRLNTAHHDDTTSVSVVGVTLQLDGVPTADVTMETSNRLTVSKLKQDSKMKAFVGIEYNPTQLK